MKLKLVLLSFHEKFLNFSANKGSSATNRKERIIDSAAKNQWLPTNERSKRLFVIIRGKELIKRALAGVGRPINELVCLVSMLNFASRSAEKTAIATDK